MSAVSWINRLHSLNEFAQEVNRAIGLAEAIFNVRLSAKHLSGSCNRMADAGAGARALEADLQGILRHLQSSSLAPSSLQRYRASWQQKCRWCTGMEYNPWLPNDPSIASRQLVLFAVYCYRYGQGSTSSRGNTLQTIQSKISAVAWYHRWEFGVNISLLPHHAMAIRGIFRLQRSPQPKQPVTLAILRLIHQQLNFSQAHDRVLWGATIMGFFFLLRCSEYLRKGSQEYLFAIRCSDIWFYNSTGQRCETKSQITRVQINFRGGKNDQAGIGTSRALTTSSLKWCCPVRAIWYLVQHHRNVSNDQDELLCKVGKDVYLQAQDVAKCIKRAASNAGQDPSRFSTHSLRIGVATALFAAGVDSLSIKPFGRWRSAVFERYTRINDEVMATMATRMVSSMHMDRPNYHQHQRRPPRHTRAGGGANTTILVPQNGVKCKLLLAYGW